MRILQIVTRSELGGAQSVVAYLAEEYRAMGHESAIAAGPEGRGEAWKGLDPAIQTFELPGLVRDISPLEELKALRSIAGMYKSWKPDIVQLHTSKAGLLGRLAPGVERRRIAYTMHGYFQLHDMNRKFLAIDKALRSRCGAIVAVSRNDERLMRADGYEAACVPNGIPDLLALPAPTGDFARRLNELRARGLPIIMVIARDAAFKRIDLAREAARRLEGKALVVWIGGEPRPEIDPPAFIALGTARAASSYLRYADIYLQPSNHEGLSMSLLEGLCAGLPCVASSVGGNLETLGFDPSVVRDDGSAGPLASAYGVITPNEAGTMASELERLCADPSLRAGMGAAARRVWAERYSSRAMAEGYLKLFAALAR